jgi:hypothetical protein
VGLSNLGEKLVNIYRSAVNVPHNSIQEIVAAWGLPGLGMMIALFFMIVKESKQYGGRKILLNFIPLVVILVKSMAGQMISSGYTMLALVLAYLSLCQNFDLKNDSNQLRL